MARQRKFMSRSSKTKRGRGRAARAESPKPKRNESERALDQALEDTYPASDPAGPGTAGTCASLNHEEITPTAQGEPKERVGYCAPYSRRRLYSVFTLTPSISAVFSLLPSQCLRVARIKRRSASAIFIPTPTFKKLPSTTESAPSSR